MGSELNKKIEVLDQGLVRLVSYMGSDSAVVQAARVSYGKGTKTVSEDEGLIRYLMRNRHTTPFEMVTFKFHLKMPIFIARQWHRHRTASINEYSGRYSEMPDEFYCPSQDIIGKQSTSNKQGTEGQLEGAGMVQASFEAEQELARDNYMDKLDLGVSREHARINLPLSQYTEFYWQINLHNLFHFLGLRLDSHAQYEIRQYAQAMYDIIEQIVPASCKAFRDYRLNSETFSAGELIHLKEIFSHLNMENVIKEKREEDNLSDREYKELISKIERIMT